jgi:hypothetical protein
VFQAGQDGAALFGFGVEVILDLDDRGNRIARLAEELQADGAGVPASCAGSSAPR